MSYDSKKFHIRLYILVYKKKYIYIKMFFLLLSHLKYD